LPGGEPLSVDVIVPLRNEASRIPEFLAMLRAQTLRPDRIIVADGMSTDGSRALLMAAQATTPGLHVIDNTKVTVPAALNTCLTHVRSPLVARMDTHAKYEPDYLAAVVDTLASRPEVCGVGGAMETAGRGPWGRAIASTLRRPFGLGGAPHRIGGGAGPVAHVFSGCYRTEALNDIGGWDERLHANEDFEADARLRQRGGKLWLEPAASSTWFVRESPRALAVQMWRYGFYKALTLRLHPGSVQPRQLAPTALVISLILGLILTPRKAAQLGMAYALAGGTLGAFAARSDGASALRGALVPGIVHLSWGSGILAGTVRFAREGRAIRAG
jgi:succinoglycan biosynthesis protein ExoA